jgi:hypothetical protein
MERLVSQRREVKAIQQGPVRILGANHSLSIRHEPSPLGPLPDRCQLPPVTSMAAVEEAAAQLDAHGLPPEARGRQNRLLRNHVGFPNRNLRVQPAATGGPGEAPSGTRLVTRMPLEGTNCIRIMQLEGSRPRT